jgi:large subunit ribosomal protein L25
MKPLKLEVQSREEAGRHPVRRLRKSGRIPAVVYGKSGSRSLSVDVHDFNHLYNRISGSSALVEISEKGGTTLSILQEIQRDPVKDSVMHIDFHEVDPNEEVTANVALHVVGTPVGVRLEGGVLDIQMYQVSVRCLPRNLPDVLEVNVDHLHNGESFHISELPAVEGVEYLGNPEDVVASVVGRGTGGIAEAEPEETEVGESGEEVPVVGEEEGESGDESSAEGGEESKG